MQNTLGSRQFVHWRLSYRSPSITLLQSPLHGIFILSPITPHLRSRDRRSPLTTHSLTVESQTRCLLGIVRPRSAHGDSPSHNNYNRIVPRAGAELPLDVCTPDARPRYRCPNMVPAESMSSCTREHQSIHLACSRCMSTGPAHWYVRTTLPQLPSPFPRAVRQYLS